MPVFDEELHGDLEAVVFAFLWHGMARNKRPPTLPGKIEAWVKSEQGV